MPSTLSLWRATWQRPCVGRRAGWSALCYRRCCWRSPSSKLALAQDPSGTVPHPQRSPICPHVSEQVSMMPLVSAPGRGEGAQQPSTSIRSEEGRLPEMGRPAIARTRREGIGSRLTDHGSGYVAGRESGSWATAPASLELRVELVFEMLLNDPLNLRILEAH